MTRGVRVLGVLQWTGLLAGAAVFVVAHGLGFALTQAECNLPGRDRGIPNDAVMIAITVAGCVAIAAAGLAAGVVYARTRGAEVGDGPVPQPRTGALEPWGRLHFFAAAALAANAIFFMIVLLNGIGAVVNVACRQS